MKSIFLDRRSIVAGSLLWLLVFFISQAVNATPAFLLNVVTIPTLLLLPGLLTFFAFELTGLAFWGCAAFVVGFSLLELMSVAFLGNAFMPYFGIARPLDTPYLLFDFYVLCSILLTIVWSRVKDIKLRPKPYILFATPRDAFIALVSVVFPIIATFGAIHLNDGGTGVITMVLLALISIYCFYLLFQADDVDENMLPTAIFFMGLSLLLMTSLRGWYITGHDIQREYKVFELARTNGIWSIAAYQDAYNACLSITILPTIFSNLLKISNPYIFKVIYQFIFALCPSLVYLISKRWTSSRVAFIAAIYFMAFPTFFSDMPFLTRQEIAFLFYGLMLYVIFDENLSLTLRRVLFVLMGIGVILSHYSTTYIVLIIFALAALSQPLSPWVISKFNTLASKRNSSLQIQGLEKDTKSKIALWMVVFLMLLSFLWTSTITNTSSSVTSVLSQTVSAVEQGFGGNDRSTDVTSLLSFNKPDLRTQLQQYITNVVGPIRANAPAGTYYPASSYSSFPIKVLNDSPLPLTALGSFITGLGIPVVFLISNFGQTIAKLSELFIPLGIAYVLFRKRQQQLMPRELYLIALFSLVFVVMNIVLPVLSVEYGIFRAIQQSMFVIAPIMVFGSIAIIRVARWLVSRIQGVNKKLVEWNENDIEIAAGVFALLFFLYSTAFIPQLFGGNAPQLHLNNSGIYYDNFVTQTQEVYSIGWLSDLSNKDPNILKQIQFEVQSDRFSATKLSSVSNLSSSNDIFPGVIRKDSFVFLSVANVVKHTAAEVFTGDRISYQYPIQFLDDHKDLIYNNGGSRIYK